MRKQEKCNNLENIKSYSMGRRTSEQIFINLYWFITAARCVSLYIYDKQFLVPATTFQRVKFQLYPILGYSF